MSRGRSICSTGRRSSGCAGCATGSTGCGLVTDFKRLCAGARGKRCATNNGIGERDMAHLNFRKSAAQLRREDRRRRVRRLSILLLSAILSAQVFPLGALAALPAAALLLLAGR